MACGYKGDDGFVQSINLLNSGKIKFSIGLNDIGLVWTYNDEPIYPYDVFNAIKKF